MCGIAGFIDVSLTGSAQHEMLDGMLEKIGHRGPDSRGTWYNSELALGHNRLSIIDLSADGNQPMHYQDLTIIFNGEIYNYLEIRKELELKGFSFRSHSDTEVILAAYKCWGNDCVNRFLGMWAFALWDNSKKELFCSRDRFGIKPFYYVFESGKFYFGSEYKALKSAPVFKSNLNYNQIARGLQLGWIGYQNETYYDCIQQLPAACNLIFKNGTITISEYWSLSVSPDTYSDTEIRRKRFKELLSDVVKIHMRSDVEIAVCLSGGIDSSSLTALIAEQFPENRFHSFSIYYDGKKEVDERPFMKAVIEKYPQVDPNYYMPDESAIQDIFNDVVYKSDVPITGSSPISHYYLVKRIREAGIKVVLDGQGADEYLAGYIPAYYRRMADLMGSGKFHQLNLMMKTLKREQEFGMSKSVQALGKGLLSTFMSEHQLYKTEYSKYYPFVVQKNLLAETPFQLKEFGTNKLDNYLYHSLFTTSLPTILHYVDRMTMASSVESRVPFLDHRLIEFAFSIPTNEKLNGTQTKSILRETLKNQLPKSVYDRRDKKGFVTPGEDKWLRGHLSWLIDKDFRKMDFLDQHIVQQVIQDYKKGNNRNSRLVWRLALLNYWLNQ